MVDVDIPFLSFKRIVDPDAPIPNDAYELRHVKVTAEAQGPTLTATLHDWYAPVETTWSWTGTIVGEKGLLGGYSDCRIQEAEVPPLPAKPRSPGDTEKEARREVPA